MCPRPQYHQIILIILQERLSPINQFAKKRNYDEIGKYVEYENDENKNENKIDSIKI